MIIRKERQSRNYTASTMFAVFKITRSASF
uniref:Uncharacterized protein n=1 Tax=Anguilla anguilla TaxID=7936 RepID=A0A0E9QZ01_ANGAN